MKMVFFFRWPWLVLGPMISGCGASAVGDDARDGEPVDDGAVSRMPEVGSRGGHDAANSLPEAAVQSRGDSRDDGSRGDADGGADGGETRGACKRGIAANVAPGAAFAAGVGWWYDWAATTNNPGALEFVPMAWDEASVTASFPAGSRFILGFNEPNFKAQANLTAEAAASQWKTLESNARAAGVPLVSPAVNFCGPAANCNGTDPYVYLKAFFAACTDCRVDYVAVHWYNCDLPSLRDYLEPGGSLEGFLQFGRPIWLTEFACAIGGDTSIAGQDAYMRAAIPYLESNPHVFRYSWFSANPIPNAKLINDDGTPTSLGRTYIGLDGDCRR